MRMRNDREEEKDMTEYEKQRLLRIKENKARLEALGLPALASSIDSYFSEQAQANSARTVPNKRRKKKKTETDEEDEYQPSDEDDDDDDDEEPIEDRSSEEEMPSSSSSRRKVGSLSAKLINPQIKKDPITPNENLKVRVVAFRHHGASVV
jgi:hypothetical protein